ncbi:hypothetical protein [Actinospica robiniae]|uniref:hypothetical protein n=1 Tax=Actinospica robiniae TaxID=304901 RepID=UPI0012F7ACF0|nr:hypothetical protein [Actinospica robiniae]
MGSDRSVRIRLVRQGRHARAGCCFADLERVGRRVPAALSAAVTGAVQSSSPGDGSRTVTLAGTAGPDVFRIAITGPPTAGGGVQTTTSRVGFGTSAVPDLYTGTVIGLDGRTIRARVSGPDGTATLTLTATISGTRLTGTFQAVPGGGR